MQLLKNAVLCSAVLLSSSWALAGWSASPALSSVGGGWSLSAKSDTGTSKPRKPRAAKGSKGGTVTFDRGSEESRSERDHRLKRECKGRSNSGLCEGYTR
jgi:hypothetical protein